MCAHIHYHIIPYTKLVTTRRLLGIILISDDDPFSCTESYKSALGDFAQICDGLRNTYIHIYTHIFTYIHKHIRTHIHTHTHTQHTHIIAQRARARTRLCCSFYRFCTYTRNEIACPLATVAAASPI